MLRGRCFTAHVTKNDIIGCKITPFCANKQINRQKSANTLTNCNKNSRKTDNLAGIMGRKIEFLIFWLWALIIIGILSLLSLLSILGILGILGLLSFLGLLSILGILGLLGLLGFLGLLSVL